MCSHIKLLAPTKNISYLNYLAKDSVFNHLKSEVCNRELGKFYTLDKFLSECEIVAKLFDESRKSKTIQDKSTTYVKNDGDEEIIESEK